MTRADLDKAPHDVAAMFDGVARRYDLTNDVLSLGQDRRWRRLVDEAVDAQYGQVQAAVLPHGVQHILRLERGGLEDGGGPAVVRRDEGRATDERPQHLRAVRALVHGYARQVSRLVVPSDYLKGIVEGWGVPPARVRVIRNTVAQVLSRTEPTA